MSVPTIQITFEGDKRVLEKLKGIGIIFSDLSQEFERVAGWLTHYYDEKVFPSEGVALGFDWMDLSRAYRLLKTKKFGGKGILEATGQMRNSFEHRIEPQQLEFFNTTDYAGYHQTGTRKMPQRVIAHINDEMLRNASEIIASRIFDRIAIKVGMEGSF